MAKKRRSAAERRRNLVLGLTAIALLLVVALLSVPPSIPDDGDREANEAAAVQSDSGTEAKDTASSDADDRGAGSRPTGAARPGHSSPGSGITGDGSSGAGTTEPDSGESEGTAPEGNTGTPEDGTPRLSAPPAEVGSGRLAVVIDDVGNDLSDLEPFLEFEGDLTIAVLPGLTGSREAAIRGRRAGKEVILHMPMAAKDGTYPGPGTISPGEDPHRLVSLLAENLQSVPGAVGVNNHMGSLTTANGEAMGVVLGYLEARGLFFLDSRTTLDTVVPSLAPSIGIPWLERDVFLDNETTRSYVAAALEEGLDIARTEGSAVLIGHVTTEAVAELLKENYDHLRALGYRFVTLQELTSLSVAETN